IRGLALSGSEELERFHNEAKTPAKIKHPNIVEIYGVGQCGSQPYFLLEFVEGGSLDLKLHGAPLPPKTAARMTELLAEAIQVAHDKGILHRDLKPANVLLSPTTKKSGVSIEDASGPGRTAGAVYYFPKIADFGLAKRIELGPDDSTGPA